MVTQLMMVRAALVTGAWMTLEEIARVTGCPAASASARIRELRAHGVTVERDMPNGHRTPHVYRIAPSRSEHAQ